MGTMLPIKPQVKPSAAYQSTFDKSIKPMEPNEVKIEMGTCQNFSSNDVTKTISIEIVQSIPENKIANGNSSDLSSQRSQVQDPVEKEFEIDDNLLTPTKRNRRAPSRLIEEDEIESSEKSPRSPKLGPKSPKPPSPKLAPKSPKSPPKSPESSDSPKSPGSPIHFDKGFKPKTYERTPTKASKESSFEIPEIPEILENLTIEEVEPVEVKVEKPEEVKSGEIEQKLATKRSQKARKNTDSGFYKPEHIELLMQTYEKCSKYPSKEEMSELAKIIGVLPIKILWWFTHRRRIERKKGDNLLAKNAKNETSEKPDSTIEIDTELNSNNLATPVKVEPEITSEIPKITAEIPKITSEKIPKRTTSKIANKISKETDETTSETLTKASEILSKTSEGPKKTSEVPKKTSESPKKNSEILE